MGFGGFCLAVGSGLPFRGWLYDFFPPSRFVQNSAMFRGCSVFSICLLAAIGCRRFGQGRCRDAPRRCIARRTNARPLFLAQIEHAPIRVGVSVGGWIRSDDVSAGREHHTICHYVTGSIARVRPCLHWQRHPDRSWWTHLLPNPFCVTVRSASLPCCRGCRQRCFDCPPVTVYDVEVILLPRKRIFLW